MTALAVRPFQNSVPGCPAETVYQPNLTKPDLRAAELAELRRLLRVAKDRLARADELLAQAARNIVTAELHHPVGCRKCAAEQASAA